MSDKPVAAGKSSFDLIDTAKTLTNIDVQSGANFLDLACGVGKYSIAIAAMVEFLRLIYGRRGLRR